MIPGQGGFDVTPAVIGSKGASEEIGFGLETQQGLPIRSRVFNPPRVYFETQAGGLCPQRTFLWKPEEALVFN